MSTLDTQRPIKIAVIAMGGQGGGVLSQWVIDLAETCGFIAQSTSVPGVAQRTGATIYYIELFPISAIEAGGKSPILSLTPVEGDVDIVIASEMMEVGRALMRGFVTGKTTLIGSSHRDYTIAEKMQLGDGRRETAQVDELARETAARYVCFDMDKVARDNGAVISSVLFGALCASGALPFTREQFEDTIRSSGKAVEVNLKGFGAGITAAGGMQVPIMAPAVQTLPTAPHLDPGLAALMVDMRNFLPASAYTLALSGLEKVIDFQDLDYGREYVERLRAIHQLDAQCGGAQRGWALSEAVSRYLALAMAFDDIVRVADIKTRSGRFETFRHDVRAEPDQVVRVKEFMHPRWQEICDIMPRRMGRSLSQSEFWQKLTAPLFGKGRRIATTSLGGFLMLFTLGRLRWLRRGSLRFAQEQHRITDWLALIEAHAPLDYDLAVEIAGLQRLIKGYGDTHEASMARVGAIVAALPSIAQASDAAAQLRAIKQAAMGDDEGRTLREKLEALAMAKAA